MSLTPLLKATVAARLQMSSAAATSTSASDVEIWTVVQATRVILVREWLVIFSATLVVTLPPQSRGPVGAAEVVAAPIVVVGRAAVVETAVVGEAADVADPAIGASLAHATNASAAIATQHVENWRGLIPATYPAS